MRGIITFLALFFSLAVSAQTFSSGKLPNGVSYYFVNNTYSKGYADFALVQKGRLDSDASRGCLSSLKLFGKIKPYQYLSSKGIGYQRTGYIRYSPFATTFDFKNVPMFDISAADSTLLAMVSISENYQGEQAVIICGDIDQSMLLERIQAVSMLVSARDGVVSEDTLSWNPTDSVVFEGKWAALPQMSSIEVRYLSKRQSTESMTTLEPILARMFAYEFGEILSRRLRRAFFNAEIPLSGLAISYSDSRKPLESEAFTIVVNTDDKKLVQASECLAKVLSELDNKGVGENEFAVAKGRLVSESKIAAKDRNIPNSAYISSCEAAYLFGSSLTPVYEDDDFLSKRILSSHKEKMLLDKFISELLSPNENIVLRFGSSEYISSGDSLTAAFANGWKSGVESPSSWKIKIDTSRITSPIVRKLKIKSTSVDPVIGGTIWTFSNGMRVLFKKTPGTKDFRYALVIKDGYGSVQGLQKGEAAWINDIFNLNNIGSLSPSEYRNMLISNEIRLQTSISLTDFKVKGSAPSNKLTLLLKSLVAMAGNRSLNDNEFKQLQRKAETHRYLWSNSEMSADMVLDSLTFPDYAFLEIRNPETLTEDLSKRAENYFSKVFANCSNGIFIIEGDLEEKSLQTVLCKYLNAFKSGNASSARVKADKSVSPRNDGKVVETDSSFVGRSKSFASIRMTAEIPFNLSMEASLKISEEVIRRAMVEAMGPLGAEVKVSSKYEFYPREIMSVTVVCKPCLESGLPSDVRAASSKEMIEKMRRTLRKVCGTDIPVKDFEGYRDSFENSRRNQMQNPDYLINAAILRYSSSKDVISQWEDSVKKVNASDVKNLMGELYSWSRVEYVVQ